MLSWVGPLCTPQPGRIMPKPPRGVTLTPLEKRVINHWPEGLHVNEIAKALGKTAAEIETIEKSIATKVSLSGANRVDVYEKAISLGLVGQPTDQAMKATLDSRKPATV